MVAPTADLPADRYGEIGAAVMGAAAELSRELGFVAADSPETGAPVAGARAA